jgi:hypothetical protein
MMTLLRENTGTASKEAESIEIARRLLSVFCDSEGSGLMGVILFLLSFILCLVDEKFVS